MKSAIIRQFSVVSLATLVTIAGTSPALADGNQCGALFSAAVPAQSLAKAPEREGLRSRLVKWTEGINKKLLWGLDHVLANHEGRKLMLSQKGSSNETLELSIGKRLGYGLNGAVYVVRELKSSQGESLLLPDDYVVKFPHSLRWTPDRAIGRPNRSSIKEAELATAIERVWEQHRTAKSLAGKELPELPLVPIVSRIATDHGELLFKPKVNGSDIKKLAKELAGESDQKRRDGLDRIFEVSEELEQALFLARDREPILKAILGDKKLDLDINPRNLVWLDKAETQRLRESGVEMGFDEGFAFFELTLLGIPDGRTRESFEREFSRALTAY